MSSWKRDFASGLIITGPIFVTAFVVYVLYSYVASVTPAVLIGAETLEPVLPDAGERTRERIAGILRVTVFLGTIGLAMLSIGYLTRTTAGGLVEEVVDYLANRVPGLRVVYNASKTASRTALGEDRSLQKPVKLEVWDGLRMTAFKTGKTTDDGRVVVFLPTSPNITTGFVLDVDPDELTDLDETVEQALTRVISGGFGDANRVEDDELPGTPIEVIDELSIGRNGE